MAQDRADDAFKEYLTRCRLMQAEELLRGKGTGRSALHGAVPWMYFVGNASVESIL